MIKSFYYTPDDGLVELEGIQDFADLTSRKDSVLWVDLDSPSDEESYILTSDFKFHPLAIEDVLSEMARPKLDDYETYLFSVVQVLGPPIQEEEIVVHSMGVFMTANTVVTVHFKGIKSLEAVASRLRRDSRLISRGADFMFHTVMDYIIDTYFNALNILEIEVDKIEDQVFEEPDRSILKRMFNIRRDLSIIRRVIIPQSEVSGRLIKEYSALISDRVQIYFSDVHDHLLVMLSTADNQRDTINSAMDLYFSMVSTKTNDVIKFLTILSALFLPATFIVGFYGMNFRSMPELSWQFGYPFAIILILAVVVGLLVFFRRKDWI